jgi:CheY-like chemotaxis protein
MAKTVLIAEDSSVILNLTKKILEQQDYVILSAKNGAEVLEILKDSAVDIILMDINMPVLDGLACAKAIRSNPDEAKRNVPILAITGNAKNYTTAEFTQYGITEFVPKPIDFDLLVNLVKKHTLK